VYFGGKTGSGPVPTKRAFWHQVRVAIRSEDDLMALLEPPEKPAPQRIVERQPDHARAAA
jgi:hypothetical protein